MSPFTEFIGRQLFIRPTPATADLTGQVGIVTGSNSGLGFGVAQQLLQLNLGQLILAVRSTDKGEAAKADLLRTKPGANIHVWSLDYSSYASIQAFAQRCAQLARLDFAVLNAAVVYPELTLNPETGHEEGLQVNVLSTALLAILLLPTLARSASPAKLTLVGSEVSEWTTLKMADCDPLLAALDSPEWFQVTRYRETKLLLNYVVNRLSKLVPADKVVINVVNPGLVDTGLARNISGIAAAVMWVQKSLLARSIDAGARPIVKAAVDAGKESHGQFYSDNACWPSLPGVTSAELEDKLWRELMREFAFAKADAVLAAL